MPTFEKFSVVVVPFPFTDQNAVKKRPALVLSGEVFNDSAQLSNGFENFPQNTQKDRLKVSS